VPGFNDSADRPRATAEDRAAQAWGNPLVRPYAISGGRTHSQWRLRPETIVRAATALRVHEGLMPELQEIVLLCHTPSALVEIAAALSIPLGVVDVLVEDLCARGLVTVDHVELGPYGAQQDGAGDGGRQHHCCGCDFSPRRGR
jgi:hypothetical protein